MEGGINGCKEFVNDWVNGVREAMGKSGGCLFTIISFGLLLLASPVSGRDTATA